jgi:hypothetical protein
MLAKNPHERVRSAEGLIRLIDALDYKFKEKTTKIQQAPSGRRKKTPMVIFLLLVIALAIISGYLFLESTRKQEITAWEIAKSTNTIVSYQEYLTQYPTGRYRQEAQFQLLFNLAKIYIKQKNYEKAREKVDEAKKIKETPQLKALEQQIKRVMK